MVGKDRTGAGLFVVGLALAALGQYTFAYRREYVWDGVLFWLGGIVLLSIALVRARRVERGDAGGGRPGGPRWLRPVQEHPVRALMATGGLGISVVVGLVARQRAPNADYVDLLVLWGGGVIAFLLAFVPVEATSTVVWRRLVTDGGLSRWLRRHRVELVALAMLVLFALVVRAYDLEHIPANLGGDEGTWAMEGLAMLDGHLANPFGTRWFAFPSMSFLIWGLSMRLFGDTVAGLRVVSALIGTVSLVPTFLLAREQWGRRVAWLATVSLAVGHYHLHFSRLAVNNIADSFLVVMALYLIVRGLRLDSPVHFALAGVTLGAGWYGYFGARLLGLVVAVYIAWRAVVESGFLVRHQSHLLILVGGALVVAAPLLLHLLAHPSLLTEGLDRISIFTSGWLAREQVITGRGAFSLLLEQFWKSVSAFNYTLDPTFWYRASIPLLDFVSGLFFIAGMVWAVVHYRWPSSALLLIWFWLALLTGWVMTENPPSSQRMIIAAPALALFFGLGLDWAIGVGMRAIGGRAALWSGVAAVVLAAVAVLNLGYYFISYTPTRVYGNPTAEMATHLSRYLAQQDDDYVVYLHGPPFVYWDLGTFRFMARGVTGVNVPPPGEGEPPRPDLGRGARFVFYGPRTDELASVRAAYPGGEAEYVRSRADGNLLYALYEVRGE